MDYQGHFINGRWTRRDGALWTSLNPAAMQPVLTATYGDGAEVDDAVAAAAKAFREWRMLLMDPRGSAATGQSCAQGAGGAPGTGHHDGDGQDAA